MEGYQGKEAYPMVAQVAIQQGKLVAANLLAHVRREPLRSCQYFDNGIMATIGRSTAVVDAFGWQFSGLLGWVIWLLVRLYFLQGIRNRLLIMLA